MKIVCIAGLPGSGKTHLAKQLAEGQKHTLVLDDFRDLDTLPSGRGNLIVVDPLFCRAETRARAERILLDRYPGAEVEWRFFENEPDKCRNNVKWRNRFGTDDRYVEPTIARLTKEYMIPAGVTPLTIWQPFGIGRESYSYGPIHVEANAFAFWQLICKPGFYPRLVLWRANSRNELAARRQRMIRFDRKHQHAITVHREQKKFDDAVEEARAAMGQIEVVHA